MNKRLNKSALIGAFLAVLVVVSFAARYEEFVVGKLTVENTATLESTLAVTGAITATGGVVGDVTGNVTSTGSEINGDVTLANDETIDNAVDAVVQVTFDDDAATLGTVKIESENAAANISAGDELRMDYAIQNDATQEVVVARIVVDFTDETATTEDGTHEIWVQVAGTLTKIASVDASGLTVVGDVSATTIGGITEANLLDKSASETVAGAWTFSTAPNAVNAITGTFTNSAGDSLSITNGLIHAIN